MDRFGSTQLFCNGRSESVPGLAKTFIKWTFLCLTGIAFLFSAQWTQAGLIQGGTIRGVTDWFYSNLNPQDGFILATVYLTSIFEPIYGVIDINVKNT